MFGSTLITELTRYREGNNQSSYRNIGLAPNIREEVRIAHTTAGKTADGNSLNRHLVGFEAEILPTAANGLKQSEKLTVNLTITHTPGIPVTTGTGDFTHASVVHALLQLQKLCMNSAATDATAGALPPASLIAGEV